MARKLRIQYPGAFYHIVNRGDRGDAIVRDDTDRQRFQDTLAEACRKTEWRVHAYCLLPDHFHLLLETPKANLVDGMKWFLGTYTARFNHRHEIGGHLFSGRYKSQILDPAEPGCCAEAAMYIHLNPARAGLLATQQPLQMIPWCSYKDYLGPESSQPSWLRVAHVLRDSDCRDDSAGRAEFGRRAEARRNRAVDTDWERFRSGWYVGGEDLRRRLLDRLHGERDDKSSGRIWRAAAEQHAETVVQRHLIQFGWEDSELGRRQKTDPEKVFLAQRIREESTVTLSWIADRLRMGSRNTLRNALASPSRSATPRKPRKATSAQPISPSTSFIVEPGWD